MHKHPKTPWVKGMIPAVIIFLFAICYFAFSSSDSEAENNEEEEFPKPTPIKEDTAFKSGGNYLSDSDSTITQFNSPSSTAKDTTSSPLLPQLTQGETSPRVDPSPAQATSQRLLKAKKAKEIADIEARLTKLERETALHKRIQTSINASDHKVGSKAGERCVFEAASGVKIAFRWCPPTGTEGFLMGSPKDEKDRGHGETQHTVHLNNGFWMAETEFTQGQWQKSMNNNPSDYKSVGKNAPVENVSWNDVQELLKKLNASGKLPKGMKLTLPTEAQWEYACRAGTSTPFHYGSRLNNLSFG